MSVSTSSSEQCPRCLVHRATLNVGGWCSTCGFNPEYERQLSDLRSALAAQVLHFPTVQYDGPCLDETGWPYVRLRISRDEWDRWVHSREKTVP